MREQAPPFRFHRGVGTCARHRQHERRRSAARPEAEAQLYPSLLESKPLGDHRADALGCEDLEQETVLYPAVENVGLRDARSRR